MRLIPRNSQRTETGFKDNDVRVARLNPNSEYAYWLAYLGFVPIIGIPFGFLAFVLSISGLLRSRETYGHVGSSQGYVAYFLSLAALLAQLISVGALIMLVNGGP